MPKTAAGVDRQVCFILKDLMSAAVDAAAHLVISAGPLENE